MDSFLQSSPNHFKSWFSWIVMRCNSTKVQAGNTLQGCRLSTIKRNASLILLYCITIPELGFRIIFCVFFDKKCKM